MWKQYINNELLTMYFTLIITLNFHLHTIGTLNVLTSGPCWYKPSIIHNKQDSNELDHALST